jgi:hypothetical protein
MLSLAPEREAIKINLQSISKPLSWYSLASLNFSSFQQIRSFIEELEPHPAKIFLPKNRPQKEKSHRQSASGGGILELLGL